MTPDEIHAARRAAAALFATYSPADHVVGSLFHAIDDLERATVEVDRLRAIEAAGERLARDVGRFVEEVKDTDDVPIRRQALRLGLALAAWEAARRGESIP